MPSVGTLQTKTLLSFHIRALKGTLGNETANEWAKYSSKELPPKLQYTLKNPGRWVLREK